jgi:hypothetical protein
VNVGDGIQIVSDAVAVKLTATNSGLAADSSGVKVLLNAAASGDIRPAIDVGSAGLAIKVDNSTVDADSSGKLRVAPLGVTAAQLAAGAVETAKIADSAVTTAKIADANVTYAKLNADVTSRIGRFDGYESGALSGTAPFSITLTAAPQTMNSALMVFINGVMRMKTLDYSLAGSTITFDSAAGQQGDDWAVYYGQAS